MQELSMEEQNRLERTDEKMHDPPVQA